MPRGRRALRTTQHHRRTDRRRLRTLLARGFGTPLVIWAWPILFVGLGLDFLFASFLPGGGANLVVAIVFIVMGLVPLGIVLRVGALRLLVGTTNAYGRAFRDGRGPTPIFGMGVRGDDTSAMPATAGDWARALADRCGHRPRDLARRARVRRYRGLIAPR